MQPKQNNKFQVYAFFQLVRSGMGNLLGLH